MYGENLEEVTIYREIVEGIVKIAQVTDKEYGGYITIEEDDNSIEKVVIYPGERSRVKISRIEEHKIEFHTHPYCFMDILTNKEYDLLPENTKSLVLEWTALPSYKDILDIFDKKIQVSLIFTPEVITIIRKNVKTSVSIRPEVIILPNKIIRRFIKTKDGHTYFAKFIEGMFVFTLKNFYKSNIEEATLPDIDKKTNTLLEKINSSELFNTLTGIIIEIIGFCETTNSFIVDLSKIDSIRSITKFSQVYDIFRDELRVNDTYKFIEDISEALREEKDSLILAYDSNEKNSIDKAIILFRKILSQIMLFSLFSKEEYRLSTMMLSFLLPICPLFVRNNDYKILEIGEVFKSIKDLYLSIDLFNEIMDQYEYLKEETIEIGVEKIRRLPTVIKNILILYTCDKYFDDISKAIYGLSYAVAKCGFDNIKNPYEVLFMKKNIEKFKEEVSKLNELSSRVDVFSSKSIKILKDMNINTFSIIYFEIRYQKFFYNNFLLPVNNAKMSITNNIHNPIVLKIKK